MHLVNLNFFHREATQRKWQLANYSYKGRMLICWTTSLMDVKFFNGPKPGKSRTFNVPGKAFIRFRHLFQFLKPRLQSLICQGNGPRRLLPLSHRRTGCWRATASSWRATTIHRISNESLKAAHLSATTIWFSLLSGLALLWSHIHSVHPRGQERTFIPSLFPKLALCLKQLCPHERNRTSELMATPISPFKRECI